MDNRWIPVAGAALAGAALALAASKLLKTEKLAIDTTTAAELARLREENVSAAALIHANCPPSLRPRAMCFPLFTF